MNSRFSVVAIALLIMGIFMLVGFAPLGVALIIIAAIIQSSHRGRSLEHHKARRLKDRDKREASMIASVQRFRS